MHSVASWLSGQSQDDFLDPFPVCQSATGSDTIPFLQTMVQIVLHKNF